jgi:hypothetical protein
MFRDARVKILQIALAVWVVVGWMMLIPLAIYRRSAA